MKKTIKVGTTVLLSSVILGLNAPGLVSADQTINNGSGENMTDEAKITTKGVLGEADNTDPGEVIPEGSDKWINVTLPTEVVFSSDENDEHKSITSPDNYKITNNSGRPVRVSLFSFEEVANGTALTSLNLAPTDGSAFTVVPLVAGNEVVPPTEPVKLVDLADKAGNIAGEKAAKDVSFKFTGVVDPAQLATPETETKAEGMTKQNVEYNMTFKFKALTPAGEVVTK